MKKLISATLMIVMSGVLVFMTGCSTTIPKNEETVALMDPDQVVPPLVSRPATYLRTYDAVSSRMIPSVRSAGLSIQQVLNIAAPGILVTPKDSGVDMQLPVTMETAPMSMNAFMDQLGRLTGYDFKVLGDDSVQVSSYMTKEWLLPMFAAQFKGKADVKGGSSGDSQSNNTQNATTGGTVSQGSSGSREISASFTNNIDEWNDIINTVQTIITGSAIPSASIDQSTPGAHDSTGAPVGVVSRNAGSPGEAKVIGIRSAGMIRAYGPASRIREADAWMKSVVHDNSQLIRLNVKIIEVTLNDSKSQGINWTAILSGHSGLGRGLVQTTANIGANFTPTPNTTAGLVTLGLGLTGGPGGDQQLNSLISALAEYGKVKLLNQPQVTTINGRPAYISAGQEFGYVSGVTQTVSTGIAQATPELARLLVGVQLSITPRLLDDNTVYMEIVPVVSSFQGFDNFSISGNNFSQPRISLEQMATTAIAHSGESVPFGGLITSNVTSTLKSLPLSERKSLGLLDPLLTDKENSLKRTELVAVVTPTIIHR